MRINRSERGDTIIEVLFAITIFSLIAVGGISLMNQGTALAQRALEIGLVRQQIDAQSDALRYLNSAYIADYGKRGVATTLWNKVVTDNAVEQAQRFDTVSDGSVCRLPAASGKPFALDLTKLDSNPLVSIANISDYDPAHNPQEEQPTFARVRYDLSNVKSQGLWVQAVRSVTKVGGGDGKVRPGFYDFHIRACWYTPGQDEPEIVGTIVRLYEPRG